MKIAASCSEGRVAKDHDFRKTKRNNVDSSLSQDNHIFIDRLQGKSIESYTNEKMQGYIDEYNQGKKPSRQIKSDYVTWHNNNKNLGKLAYEFVMQFGEHEDLGRTYYESQGEQHERVKKIFIDTYGEWINEFQEQFPHLEVLYAVAHLDEPNGTPHIHMCIQPMGEDYKKGLSHQIAIGKALGLDGIERVEKRGQLGEEGGFQLKRLYRKIHHEIQNPTLERMGFEIKQEIEGRKHIDSLLYPTAAREITEQAKETAKQTREAAKQEASTITQNAREISAQTQADAKAKAKEIITAANSEAVKAQEKAEAAKKEKEDIEAKTTSLKNEYDEALKQMKEMRTQTQNEINHVQEIINNAKQEHSRLSEQSKKLKEDIEELEKYQYTTGQIERVKRDIEKIKKNAYKKGIGYITGREIVPIELDTATAMITKAERYDNLDNLQNKLEKQERDLKRREDFLESQKTKIQNRERALEEPEAEQERKIQQRIKEALELNNNIYKNKAEMFDKVEKERNSLRDEVAEYREIAETVKIAQDLSLQDVIDYVHHEQTQNVVPNVAQRVANVITDIKCGVQNAYYAVKNYIRQTLEYHYHRHR